MTQETMNIALPESMKEFVRQQVAEGGYSTASEYVRELIRTDQKRKAGERLEALLLQGLDSGDATPLTKKDWNRIRAEVGARLKKSNRE
jgi:antitoxin ParD1/3/4